MAVTVMTITRSNRSKPNTIKCPISNRTNRAFYRMARTKVEINAQLAENQQQVLRALSTTNPDTNKMLREAIFQELKAARNAIVNSIKFKEDPRGTAHAVRRYVAKKYLGGVVSILPTRHSPGPKTNYEPPRKPRTGQRGGNRMLRSQRTDDIMHYGPMDRDFILYYVDQGTNPRYAAGRNGKWGRSGGNRTFGKLQDEGEYFRGSIAPRNFFGKTGPQAMQHAVENLGRIIDEEWQKVINS